MKYLNIKKALAAWQNLQPLSEKDRERLSRRFTVDFNYNSNHIEGNTLTYGQTEILLLFGKVIGEADVRDVQEMTASNVGLRMMTEEATVKGVPLTQNFIRTLHKTILEKTGNIKQDLDMPIVKIRAKGANDDDIERAIRGYLRWNATDKQFGLLFMKDNVLLEPFGFDTAEQKIRKGLEQHDRIFFFRWQLAQKLSIKQTLENDPLERLKKCFRQEVLNMSLIIADIVIDIPIIALTQELLS